MKILSANVGFVTNSSSVVYHFPKEIIDNPDIQAFIKAFEIDKGYVGDNLWHRGECGSFIISKEQKQEALADFNRYDYSHPGIDNDEDQVVIIIGDEYTDITSILCDMMQKVANKMGLSIHGDDYN